MKKGCVTEPGTSVHMLAAARGGTAEKMDLAKGFGGGEEVEYS